MEEENAQLRRDYASVLEEKHAAQSKALDFEAKAKELQATADTNRVQAEELDKWKHMVYASCEALQQSKEDTAMLKTASLAALVAFCGLSAQAADLSLRPAPTPRVEAPPVYVPPRVEAPAPVAEECITIRYSSPRPIKHLTFLVWGGVEQHPGCGLKYLGSCPVDCRDRHWGSPDAVYGLADTGELRVPASMAARIRSAQLCAFGQGLDHIDLGPHGWIALRNGSPAPLLKFRENRNFQQVRASGASAYAAVPQAGAFRLASVNPEFAAMQRTRVEVVVQRPMYRRQVVVQRRPVYRRQVVVIRRPPPPWYRYPPQQQQGSSSAMVGGMVRMAPAIVGALMHH